MEKQTEFKINKKIPGTGKLPLRQNTQINLDILRQIVKGTTFLNGDTQHPAYLQLQAYINGEKNSFKIFREGKVTCLTTISPKAWTSFLDFFYYGIIEPHCLEDKT